MEMHPAAWYTFVGVALVAIGFLGVALADEAVRKILALNVMGSGVFLALVAPADRLVGRTPDPVPHAMVLTGIVVAVSATAVALALARRIATGGADATDEPQA